MWWRRRKKDFVTELFFSVFLSNLSVCRVAKKTLTNHHVISQQSAYVSIVLYMIIVQDLLEFSDSRLLGQLDSGPLTSNSRIYFTIINIRSLG